MVHVQVASADELNDCKKHYSDYKHYMQLCVNACDSYHVSFEHHARFARFQSNLFWVQNSDYCKAVGLDLTKCVAAGINTCVIQDPAAIDK